MKTASAKAKGRRLQQFVAATLSRIFDWEEGDAVSRPMGSSGVDIMMSPRARRDFPFSIESKNWKKFPGLAALEQARNNTILGTIPCLVWKPFRASEEDTVIVMKLTDLAEAWRENAKTEDITV